MEQLRQSRLTQSESGQAMVEFALTITMTLLLIFALIDFSRAIYTASVLQWAAQNGARAAIINPTDEAVYAAVTERMIGLDLEKLDPPVLTTTSENVVQVSVTYEFEFIAPIVAQITGDSIEMSSSASMIAH